MENNQNKGWGGRKKPQTNKNILEGKRSIKNTLDNKDQSSISHTLFQNEMKPAEFIKVASALLLQPPDHCESNHWETKDKCDELAGKRKTSFHFFYSLQLLNLNKVL